MRSSSSSHAQNPSPQNDSKSSAQKESSQLKSWLEGSVREQPWHGTIGVSGTLPSRGKVVAKGKTSSNCAVVGSEDGKDVASGE